MFKTIFGKMLVIFIFILIFCFSITGIMMYLSLDRLTTSEKEKTLYQSIDQVNDNFTVLLGDLQSINSSEYSDSIKLVLKDKAMEGFQSYLDWVSNNTSSLIWIIDPNGHILLSDTRLSKIALPEKTYGHFRDDTGSIKLPDESQYSELVNGKKSEIKLKSDFYGFLKNSEYMYLTIAKPLTVMNNNKMEIKGSIYFHTPIPELKGLRESVFKLFMISMGIAVLISVFLVYIFSRRLTKPLKQINNAAKVIAGGEFRNRLDIKSKDEIGELANSFNQMGVALQNLEEMRRGFVANVSHELRTPMTSIRGFVEGILDGTIPPERQKGYLTIVRDETNRLNRLINDLLDLAKMESGEIALNLRPFNIDELIRRCIIKLEKLITDKNINVEAYFESDEMFVNADGDSIERVVINLLHNAIKFTPDSGKISISTVKNKDKVFVSIQDTGTGIAPEELNMIWDRFYKSDKSRGRDKTGTGLGLAIVKNIINEHKQEIKVESELNVGTKFTFSLDADTGKN